MRNFTYLLIAFSLAACANPQGSLESVTEQSTQCEASMAQIAVMDGFMQNLCGCAEPASPAQATGTLTCTVAAGTTVYFHYVGTMYEHEVISRGTPSFISSPISKPGQLSTYPVHVVPFSTAGTYEFFDAYNPTVDGSIIVL